MKAEKTAGCFVKARRVVLSVTFFFLCTSCAFRPMTPNSGGVAQAKYVFLFIGDGMGLAQRTAAEKFLSVKSGDAQKRLLMNQFPAQGITTTYAENRFIAGSAATATALACGVKTKIDHVGVDANLRAVASIAEIAKRRGRKVGIVSSVSIDHATPACFYAHQPSRKMFHEIAFDLVGSGFDYFGGGGMKDPTGKKSKKPMGDALWEAERKGYAVVQDRKGFLSLNKGAGKVIAINENLPDGEALPYDIDSSGEDISLREFTKKGIELLDNPEGFFMMVEGGKIDWACHANDAVAAFKDIMAFDEAIQEAYIFYENHPKETLIVVTGDHECGGLALGYAGTVYATHFEVLQHQKVSFQVFTDRILRAFKKEHGEKAGFEAVLPLIEEYFGLAMEGSTHMALKDYEREELEAAFSYSMAEAKTNPGTLTYLRYGFYDPLTLKTTQILSNKAGLGWTSYSHTAVPVTTSAIGVGSELFNGAYDNTDVAKKILLIMGVSKKMETAPHL